MNLEVLLCALTLVATAEQQQASASAPATLELLPIERNIVAHTNAQRKRYGLPELEVDPELVKSARAHCIWMTRNRLLRHTSRPVGENIAMGQRSSEEVVADWMSSSGHRANILHRRYRRIGVAAYRTPDGTIFWCQQFR